MLPPFAERVLSEIALLYRAQGGPVRTAILADLLGISARTCRWYAARLEQAGKVQRRSMKTGWLPV